MFPRTLRAAALVGLLSSACTQKGLTDPTTATPQASQNKISVVGAASVKLGPNEFAALRFLVATGAGAAVPGARVDFAFQGSTGGAFFSSDTLTTQDDGTVEVRVVAGAQAATFQAIASSAGAGSAQVSVTVSGDAAGTHPKYTGSVVGKYATSMAFQPLGFMNQNSAAYAYTSDLVNFLVDPAQAILYQWISYDSTAHTTHLNAMCPGSDWYSALLCAGGAAAIQGAITAALGADQSGQADAIYAAFKSAGQMLKSLNVGGLLTIKSYNPDTHAFTASLSFDAMQFIWHADQECQTGGARANDPCCGHHVFEAQKAALTAFMTACASGSNGTSCGDLTGNIVPDQMPAPGQAATSYTMTLDAAQLSLAYGTLVVKVLETLVFPAVLPAKFTRQPDGSVKLADFIAALLNLQCSPSDFTCNAVKAAITVLITELENGLVFNGTSDWSVSVAVTGGKLQDTDGDQQVDSITGNLAVTAMGANGSAASNNVAFSAALSGDACTGDASCNGVGVCRFAKSAVDACFARNFCGPQVGLKVAADSCQTSRDCASGTCMAAPPAPFSASHLNTCFEACATASDCAGGLTCDTTGYVVATSMNNQTVALYSGTCVH